MRDARAADNVFGIICAVMESTSVKLAQTKMTDSAVSDMHLPKLFTPQRLHYFCQKPHNHSTTLFFKNCGVAVE